MAPATKKILLAAAIIVALAIAGFLVALWYIARNSPSIIHEWEVPNNEVAR